MPPARSKRLLFGCLTLALLVVAVEAIAYLGLGLTSGAWFSPGELQVARDRRTGAVSEDDDAGGMRRPVWVQSAAIHPFVGFVEDPGVYGGEITDFGYYEVERPLFRRSPDKVILGIFGGSFAYQFRESAVDELIAALRRDPRFAGREFVVTSPALGGYKQPQQLMTLNWLLALGGEFDIVVNIDGFNEVALHERENRTRHVFPAYPRSWYFHALGIGDGELVERAAEVRRLQRELRDAAAFHSRSPWRWSGTFNLVWMLRDRRLEAALAAGQQRLADYESAGERYVATGPAFDHDDDEATYAALVDVWKQSSLQMALLCRANGILYVHALQPNQYVEGSKPLSAEEKRLYYRIDHPYRTGVLQGYPRLRDAGRELSDLGVPFLDLTQLYAEVPGTIYRDDCCHVSEEGYRMIVAPVAEAILAGESP